MEIKDANKGGLILEWQGIQGFLPASQLKAEHYPHVEDSDKDKILKELKKLVKKKNFSNDYFYSPQGRKINLL